jgi:hypothetical protein
MSESDSPQTIDIVTRLRQWQDRREDPTPREVMDEAAAEVERLRLTKAERFVLREVCDTYANEDDIACNEIAAVIAVLLERTK